MNLTETGKGALFAVKGRMQPFRVQLKPWHGKDNEYFPGIYIANVRPASWSREQSFWLLIMRSQDRFPVLPWGFFLEGEDSHGDHSLGSLVELRLRPLLVLHIHISSSTSSGQRNCASWASQPQKSVTLRPQPGGETAKSIRDMWWKKNIVKERW
jgi:hypothetical protein